MNKSEKYIYLRPKKLGKYSKDFFVFDVETGIKYPDGRIEYMLSARPEHFIFAVVYGKNGYKVFHSLKELQKEFKRKEYKRKTVYAHNAEYDLSCTFGNIYHLDPDAIFNGKFVCATNGICMFADSYNILPTSVKKLGKLLGLEKMELGKNLQSFRYLMDDVDIPYCVRDCEIVYRSLQKVFEDTEPSFTIGSLSLKLFRKKYLRHTIKVNRKLADQFFSAYYGGRTEAFYIGECNAEVYDINSAYPWAMLNGNFINPSTLKNINPEIYNAGNYALFDDNMHGMIDATVHVHPDEYLPVLPVRMDGKLLFPCGTFRGQWMLSEFRYALQKSMTTVKNIHNLIIAETVETPFKNFVQDIYNMRQKTNDEFERYYFKLFLNNLYGKFAQRTKDKYKFFNNEHDAIKFISAENLFRAELIKVIGGYFCRYDKEKFYAHTIAPWAAEITAQVRIKLHTQIQKYEDRILYCDTDSIFLSGINTVKNSSELGGWKKENKTITNIRALKDYIYFEDDKDELLQMLKGVKKDAIPFDEYGNVFKYKRMIKTRESFVRKDNLPPGTFIEQVKFISGDYKKRQILKGGKTKPFIL